ncbi:hypothetical protein Btru_015683 [Bulinus truncatus]|nr:hypothetical protein Btru_015683 [Bulinus truncatus]
MSCMDLANASHVSDDVGSNGYDLNIPDDITEMIRLVCYVILSPVISIAGIMANIVNIWVYYKHGLSESVNVSFLTLAVTDLMGLLFCIWYGIGVDPLLTSRTDLTFDSLDVTYITGAFPRVLFSKMTCWITVYVSLERCVCVVAPLHVKTLITPTRTVLILTLLYVAGVITNFPILYLGSLFLTWKSDTLHNRTFIGMGIREDYFDKNSIINTVNAVLFLNSFTIIAWSTIILIARLHKKSQWRQISAITGNNSGSNGISKRDTVLSKTIVLLSVALIVSYLPYTVNCMLMAALDGFMLHGKYNNFFLVMWSFSWLLETLNSTTSIFIYYTMSTKYKETFRKLFSKIISAVQEFSGNS